MNDCPKFSVNGVPLSYAQNMAVWAALQGFGMEMEANPDGLGTDEHGRFMTKAYLARVREINKICQETSAE